MINATHILIMLTWVIPGACVYLRNNPDPTWEVLSGGHWPVKLAVLGPGILVASIALLFVSGLMWVLAGDIYPEKEE